MKSCPVFVLYLLSLSSLVFAQTSESGMEPSLGSVFPFVQGEGKVTIKFPVMINKRCVIPADAWARVIYIQPKEGDAVVKKARKRLEDRTDAYVRVPDQAQKTQPLTAVERATQEIALKEIWPSETAFRAALERMQREFMRFVFQGPKDTEPQIENVEFPQGLLLSEQNGKVIVLSVIIDSNAQKAGLVAGTEIVTLDGKELKGSLPDFQKIYYEEMANSSLRQLVFTIKSPGSTEIKTVSIRLPMSLNSDIWSQMK